LVDLVVGDFVASLDPLASLGLLVFLLILGPLVDFRVGDLVVDLRSLAIAVAQRMVKRTKRRAFKVFMVKVESSNADKLVWIMQNKKEF
jgi:hypothetical protein